MRWLVAALIAGALSVPVRAAVAEGENLLINGRFEAEQVAFPEFWVASSSRTASYLRTGGPEGKMPAVVLHGDGSAGGAETIRQQGLVLVAGETYKLSAYIKTKGFKSRHAGLVLHNTSWLTDIGFNDLPADSEWTFLEKTFTLFPSSDKEYGIAMFAVDMSGEVHFADVKLEAVSPAARAGSVSQTSLASGPRLVPLQPLLNHIPRARPELTLRLYGVLPQKRAAYECVARVPGAPIAPQTLALSDGPLVVGLAGLPCADYNLQLAVRQRETQQAVLEVAYPISIIDLPALDRTGIRPLNNLVSELLNQPLQNTPAVQTFPFVNPRDGWVFVACGSTPPAAGRVVRIDDRDTVISAGSERAEAFRNLPMGEHRISVAGAGAEARLLVRSIPEIFDYPPCAESQVKENGSYGWEFMKKHVLPAVTTLNGGALPGDALPEAKARGLKWLANFSVAPVDDAAKLRERMESDVGMTAPQYDGFTSDELFFGRAGIDHYTRALWQLRNPADRLVYTWIVGRPSIAAAHTDFISAALNASRGRGRLLFEAYCHPQADEKAAAAYLDDMIGETMRSFNAFFPNAAAGTGIIFGNFNQIPIISLEHNPAVDFRYYLDMQVNLVANHPDFAGLATTGYWGTYYGDEELARWSFLLMRHYAVEGNKDMLSSRYGFTYNPGFLANPDFAAGLQGWTAVPAAAGSIRPDTIPDYGNNSQGRWGGGSAGDTVCVMTRHPDKPNRISQTVQGLQVGKAYCLQFVSADRQDVLTKKRNPRRYGIDAELQGAEILTDKSFVYIDRREGGANESNNNVAKINLQRLVFRATAPSQVIAFSDAKATPGEELMFNFVQLKRYLE